MYDISLLIAPQNSAPLLQGATVKTPEDVAVWIPLLVSDPEDDPVLFELITQAQHGTVTVQEGVLRYVPEDDFFRSDVFEVVANDGSLTSEVVEVFVNVLAVNDAPRASDITLPGGHGDRCDRTGSAGQ